MYSVPWALGGQACTWYCGVSVPGRSLPGRTLLYVDTVGAMDCTYCIYPTDISSRVLYFPTEHDDGCSLTIHVRGYVHG